MNPPPPKQNFVTTPLWPCRERAVSVPPPRCAGRLRQRRADTTSPELSPRDIRPTGRVQWRPTADTPSLPPPCPAGTAEELAAAETLVTFGGAGPEEQDGPIDLSVGGGRQAAAAAAPRRSPADVLRPLAAPEQLALMYAALARLAAGREERPAPLQLPAAGQRYTLELELSAKQSRLSTEPAAALAVPAGSGTSPRLKEEAVSPAARPPEDGRPPAVAEEVAQQRSPPPPPTRPVPSPTQAAAGSDTEIDIDVVSAGEETDETPATPSDGAVPPSTGGMQAILKDIFNQVRHERASAGFAPTRPESAAAAAASGAAEPAASAPSLMHPNVTAGQPGLALTRPTQRSEPAEPQHSDSSFFNRFGIGRAGGQTGYRAPMAGFDRLKYKG